MYEWTDRCAAQYKARSAFADICIQNIKLERNFFETCHGKRVCDGLGAVIKNICYQAVLTGKAFLSTADDVYSYCSSRLSILSILFLLIILQSIQGNNICIFYFLTSILFFKLFFFFFFGGEGGGMAYLDTLAAGEPEASLSPSLQKSVDESIRVKGRGVRVQRQVDCTALKDGTTVTIEVTMSQKSALPCGLHGDEDVGCELKP